MPRFDLQRYNERLWVKEKDDAMYSGEKVCFYMTQTLCILSVIDIPKN